MVDRLTQGAERRAERARHVEGLEEVVRQVLGRGRPPRAGRLRDGLAERVRRVTGTRGASRGGASGPEV